ncbi:hypothetical protein [Sandarakinorhabdus oryzae]|uniref:hypothetical protein n=1 Tax=Sandarakinorhabdus oryzae TaxID=2675220 RepID=UPI0012E10DD9|nr:hypothetical protein [Sandarakinorhabdus oryzae]
MSQNRPGPALSPSALAAPELDSTGGGSAGPVRPGPLRVDQVPRSVVVERRLTSRALAAWQTAPEDGIAPALAPFFDHSIIVRDPAGRAIIDSVGGPVSARFGLVAGVPLLRDPGLSDELVAACELVALQPMPIPFEASVNDPMGAQMLVRGLALPLPEDDDPAALVQIVLSWREILSKSAARRLRAELASAFADVPRLPPITEPFPRRPGAGRFAGPSAVLRRTNNEE